MSSGDQVLEDVINSNTTYQDAGLNLQALINPKWIHQDSEMFYGFWGQVLNRYQRIRNFEACKTLLNWRNALFQPWDERFQEDDKGGKKGSNARLFKQDTPTTPLAVPEGPKRFYLATSNIDAEAEKVGFKTNEIYETRGNICTWQCSVPCVKEVWKVDDDFRFEVSAENGKAPTIKFVERSVRIISNSHTNVIDHKKKTYHSSKQRFITINEPCSCARQ